MDESSLEKDLWRAHQARQAYESLSMYMIAEIPIVVHPTVANRIGLLNAIFIQEYFPKCRYHKFRPAINDSAVLSDEEWKNCIEEMKDLDLLGVQIDKKGKEFFGMNVPDIIDFLAKGYMEEGDE